MIAARKIYKIPEFYMIFARKMPEFYRKIAQEIFSRILGGTCPPCPPISYAYVVVYVLDVLECLSIVLTKAVAFVLCVCMLVIQCYGGVRC